MHCIPAHTIMYLFHSLLIPFGSSILVKKLRIIKLSSSLIFPSSSRTYVLIVTRVVVSFLNAWLHPVSLFRGEGGYAVVLVGNMRGIGDRACDSATNHIREIPGKVRDGTSSFQETEALSLFHLSATWCGGRGFNVPVENRRKIQQRCWKNVRQCRRKYRTDVALNRKAVNEAEQTCSASDASTNTIYYFLFSVVYFAFCVLCLVQDVSFCLHTQIIFSFLKCSLKNIYHIEELWRFFFYI